MANTQIPNQIVALLDILKINPSKLVGKGGEGFIFEYSDNKVIKIYPKTDVDYLQKLQSFQNLLLKYSLPYNTPQIIKIDCINDIYYTIENRLRGQQLDTVFPNLSDEQKLKVLRNYFEALTPFNSIEFANYSYGQILEIKDSIKAESWSEFLISKLTQQLKKSSTYLPKDIKAYDKKVELIKNVIVQNCNNSNKNLVHCDYYLNNVLVDENLEISAVLDFSIHASVGDKRIDVASLAYLTLDKNIKPVHVNYLLDVAKSEHGQDIEKYIKIYGLYYGFYYADSHEFNTDSYKWCVGYINNDKNWIY